MPVLSFVTPEEHSALQQQVAELRAFLAEFVGSIDDEVSTQKALELTGIKSRTTLIEERDRPGSLIRYSKHGRSAAYSRASCIAYKLSRRLGQHQPTPAPTTLRLAS